MPRDALLRVEPGLDAVALEQADERPPPRPGAFPKIGPSPTVFAVVAVESRLAGAADLPAHALRGPHLLRTTLD